MKQDLTPIIIASDDPALRQQLLRCFGDQSLWVRHVLDNSRPPLRQIGDTGADQAIILLDDTFSGGGAAPADLSLLAQIRGAYPETTLITLGDTDSPFELAGLDAGVFCHVAKPVPDEVILTAVKRALEHRELVTAAQARERQERDANRLTHWWRQKLHAIQEISTALNAAVDLEQIFHLTCKAAYDLFDVDHSGLVLVPPEATAGRVVAEYPLIGTKGLTIPIAGVAVEEDLVATRDPLILADVEQALGLGPVLDIFHRYDIRSVLIVPVATRGRMLVSFSLDAINRRRDFTDEEVELCQIFAAHIAVALENARLFAEISQHNQQLEILRQTTLAITSPLDRDTLLNLIVQKAVELLNGASGGIYEYRRDQDELVIIADHGRPASILGHQLKSGEGMAGKLVHSGEPYMIVHDYNSWTGRAGIYDDRRPFGAVIEVPLKWQDQVIGVLFVDDRVGRKFVENDARLLELFADQAAIALVNANLVAADAAKLQRLESLARGSSEIMNLLGTQKSDTLLQVIGQYAAEILQAEGCGILLVRRPGYLSFEASFGYRPGAIARGREFKIQSGPKTGLTGHIAFEGKLFNARHQDLLAHPAVAGIDPPPVASGKCHSLIAIPLMRRRGGEPELLGLLRVDNKKDRNGRVNANIGFSQEDEWILRLFAEAIVAVIDGASFLDQLAEQKDHWQRLIASSPNGVIAIDDHGLISAYNSQAEATLGYPAAAVMGKRVDILYDNPREPNRIGELLNEAGGRLVNYETFVKSKSGERIPIRLSATWLLDAHGRQVGSVGYFEDLRAIQDIERRLALLLQANNVVAKANNLTDGLQQLAQMLVALSETSFCRIFLLSRQNELLLAKADYISTQGQAFHFQLPIGGTIDVDAWPTLSEFLNESGPSLYGLAGPEGQLRLQQWAQCLGLGEQVQSLFLIPLRTRNREVGLMCLGDLRAWNAVGLTRDKTELAAAIADQTAVLIDQVYLLELTERHRQLLLALDEASRSIRAEKDTEVLMPEAVRLAVELVGFSSGGLYVNQRYLGHLELSVVHKLPAELKGSQLPSTDAVIGAVAAAGSPRVVQNYSPWPDVAPFTAFVALPLKLAGGVEAVLFVADNTGRYALPEIDLEILTRFATQVSMALRTSRLINQEQRIYRQMEILNKISQYLQSAGDLDKILHIVLTGVTAGFSLGLNRAALFLLDKNEETCLVGHLGIGHIDEKAAFADWYQDRREGRIEWSRYLELLENDEIGPTPIDNRIKGLRLPLAPESEDLFWRTVDTGSCFQIKQDQLALLPQKFRDAFDPAEPLVLVPLVVRDKPIGLLAADNKFTQTPILEAEIKTLFTFANTAAVAIDNARLLQEVKSAQANLRTSFEASNALVSAQQPGPVLQAIVEQACKATGSVWVSLILIDDLGHAHELFTTGKRLDLDINQVVRPDGISMQVMRSGRVIAVEDTNKARDRVNSIMFAQGIGSALCLPLASRGKPIGVMWVHYAEPRRFAQAEVDAFQLYVNQAAIAYENARRLDALEHMRQAAEGLAGAASLPEVLSQIVQSAREVLLADSTAIWSYDDVQNKFIPESSVASGIPVDIWETFRQQEPSPGQTAFTVMERGWIGVSNITDADDYPYLGQSTRQLLPQIGVQSFQGIALTVGDEKLGVLYVNYNRQRSFNEEEQGVAQTYANHAALALKKAKLLDQVNKVRNTARVVAKVTTLKDLNETLQSVVSGTRDALNCDAVVLYVYDPSRARLYFPPTMIGVRDTKGVQRLPHVEANSLVFDMLRQDGIYIADNVNEDPFFKGKRFSRDEQIISCAAVPLTVDQQKMGVMFVNYRTEHRFTGDEMVNIELFSSQAAVAIHDAQLYEQARGRAEALQALYEAGRMINASLDLNEILAAIAEQAWKLTGIEGEAAAFSNLSLRDGNELEIVAAYPPERLPEFQRIVGVRNLDQGGHIGVTGRVVKTGRSELLADVTSDPDYIRYDELTRSELAVPIRVGDRIIGVINVEHEAYSAFDSRDQDALEALALQAAIAIQNAQAYRETRVLQNLSMALTGTLDQAEVLNLVMRAALELTKTTSGSILFWDEQSRRFAPAFTTSGPNRTLEPYTSTARRDGLAMSIMRKRAPEIVGNALVDARISEVALVKRRQALIGVPLLNGDNAMGVLFVNSSQPRHFSQHQMLLLATLANQVATAIAKARQYEELKETKGLIGASLAVAWMGMASSTWRHAIEGHAITIRDELTLMADELGLAPDHPRRRKIRRQVQKILDRPITPPLSDEGLEPVSINDLLCERIDQLRQNEPFRSVNYEFDLGFSEGAIVRASSQWLRQVIDILVDNAAKSMRDGGARTLTLVSRPAPDGLEIWFSDTGHEIPDAVAGKLFRERINSTDGLGMGLLMAATIIQVYGGRIRLESTGPKGTTFALYFPAQVNDDNPNNGR